MMDVEQCDRDAAGEFGGWDDFADGKWDGHKLVQLLARHRATAEQRGYDRCQREVVAWLRAHKAFAHIGAHFIADAIESGEFATAIEQSAHKGRGPA